MVAENDDERREKSELARVAAIRERIERQKERDRIVKESIANVDKKAKNRIVFEDSDDDDDNEGDDEKKEPSSSKSKKSSTSSKPKLFDSEDEDDNEEEETEIEIKNRHSGAKGEQLMKMETRFNSDPRFKLNDKFVESDDSEEETEDQEKIESKQEKEKNRELLSKILGKNVTEVKKPENKTLMARPFTRFDPGNPEHVEWMKAFEESKRPKKDKEDEKKKERKEKEDEDDEEKSEKGESSDEEDDDEDDNDENPNKPELFYQYDDQFSNELKKDKNERENGSFSFLAMMGRNHEVNEEDDNEEDGDNEEDETKEDVTPAAKSAPVVINNTVKISKFFVDSTDEQVRSMAMNFRRTQNIQKVIDRWTPHRDAIFKLWKKQRKDAMNIEKGKFTDIMGGGSKRKRKHE